MEEWSRIWHLVALPPSLATLLKFYSKGWAKD